MSNLEELEHRLQAVEQRNAKVTTDKAWETSLTRRLSIAALTYIIVIIYLSIIGNSDPFINAIVPVVGYLLSTLALGQIKRRWAAEKQ